MRLKPAAWVLAGGGALLAFAWFTLRPDARPPARGDAREASSAAPATAAGSAARFPRAPYAQLAALEHGARPDSPEAASALLALRTWAESDPAAALAWARACGSEGRLAALIAALEGAAKQPHLAIQLARELLRDEPELAADCGTAFVGALIRTDAFGVALEFARGGPPAQRTAWLAALFGAWAGREPAFAGELARLLGAHGAEGPAYRAVIEHWAAADPSAAAAFALNLPTGPTREVALRIAVERWVVIDPEALAAALPRFGNPAERDVASVTLVCGTDALNRPTASALAWAEAIVDPAARQRALAHVLKEWAQQDRAAAERYVEDSNHLGAAEREALLGALRPPREQHEI